MSQTQLAQALPIIAQVFACDEALASAVTANARYRSYPPRTTIIEGGSSPEAIFLVISGHARMVAFSVDGRLVVVRDFAEGDIFGEGGLVESAAAADEVVAVDSVGTASFFTHVFIALMSSHACIALAISRLLVARLSATTQRLVEGATLSAVGRVHAELLRQAKASADMSITPPPVLSVLALSVQTTRETVSRAMSALEKRGIVRRDAQALHVVAPHRLEELVY